MLESLTFDLTGIYLTEFRHLPHSRKVVATILCVSSFWPVASAKLLSHQLLILCAGTHCIKKELETHCS